ncbi:MAG: cation transporter [Actinomycetales bacterium]|nr:MAG: cation transporter [Actinomycetales bacterium]
MSTEGGTKAVLAAAAANGTIALAKFGAWLLTGASSLLAEAIHSIADTGNQALLLIGGKRSKKTADEDHPFGYGKERYLSAFLVSIILFSVGGMFALYEAYHKYHEVASGHPDELLTSQWWWVPIAVLVLAIVAESFSLRTAVIETNAVRGKKTLWRFVRASKSPELPVILLEDIAALTGLVFALAGVGLTLVTGNAIFDVIGTAAIGFLLVIVAIILAVETKSLLIGEAASPEAVKRIKEAITKTAGVEQIIHVRTMHLGPESMLLAAKIAVNRSSSAAEIIDIINAAEVNIRAVEPSATALYLEPDFYDPNYISQLSGNKAEDSQ